jgi:Rod binding domain-containing protein
LAAGSNTHAQNASEDKHAKVSQAATQFEALMISQMMKSAREEGGSWLGDGDEAGADSAMGLAEEQFAQAMSNRGGIGLAGMIVRTICRDPSGAGTKPTEAAAKTSTPI